MAILQSLAAFLLAALFYFSLYGDLRYHDVERFINEVQDGKYLWDMGHVWLQPVALLWNKYLSFGFTPEANHKHMNTLAAAAAAGVFHLLLYRLGVPLWQRIAAVVLVTAACNVLTLAPSAHPKLVAFPFLTTAFLFAVRWEMLPGGSDRHLVLSAVFLAIAAAFHSSIFSAPPFVGLAILLSSLRAGDGWRVGLQRMVMFGAVCGLLFLLLLEVARLVFFGEVLTVQRFMDAVHAKHVLRTGLFSLVDIGARMAFSTVNNLIAAPDLGPVIRAWLAGQVASLKPYAGTLVTQAVPFLATLALIAVIYLRSLYLGARGAANLVPIGFAVGVLVWNVFFDINEPEHWYELTVPTVFLGLLALAPRWDRPVLPVWAAVTLAVNLALWALPQARYPVPRYEAELRQQFGPNDLLIDFMAYRGTAGVRSFSLPGVPRLMLDDAFEAAGNVAAFQAEIERTVGAAFQRGGRVVVLGVFDPENWNSPWMLLTRAGMPKSKLVKIFEDRYRVTPLGTIAEIPAWQLAPK